jgi:hypothetical protein
MFTLTRSGGTNAVTATVTLSGTALSSGTTRDYNLQINGSPLTVTSGSISVPFAANQNSVQVTVLPVDDTVVEGSETLIATVSTSSLYNVGSPNAVTLTITDNDVPPPSLPVISLTATSPSAAEGGANGAYTITRSGDMGAVIVRVNLSGTATSSGTGTDYNIQYGSILPSGTSFQIPFSANQTSAQVNLLPYDDTLVEGSETVIATVASNASYTLGSSISGTVTIADNDSNPPPGQSLFSIVATDPTASEALNTDTGLLTITRTGTTSAAVTLKLSIGGTTRTQDFQIRDGSTILSGANPTVTFAANQTSKVLTVIAVPNFIYTGTQWVSTTLVPDAAYGITSPNSANVALTDANMTCEANMDRSTIAPILNINDYSTFLNYYQTNNPHADMTHDGRVNYNDMAAFQNAFAAGCP